MLKNITILFAGFLLLANMGCAQPVSSGDLINKAKEYDNKPVDYEGEVIGDIMARGQYVWINVNDGQNAVGVWADRFLAKEITFQGGYQRKGDIIRVFGVFHQSCPEHGGDVDIHARMIKKITAGKKTPKAINYGKLKSALILSGILLLLIIWNSITEAMKKKRPVRQ